MIYLDIPPEDLAKRDHFKLEIDLDCVWKCGKTMTPKSIRTKDSIGIRYECDCGAWMADLRPYTKEAKEFWNLIV